MGNRAHVNVRDGNDSGVWLYAHWDGAKLPYVVKTALIRGRLRWHDASYLARIIFCEMIKDDVLGETGYGISSAITDTGDGHRVILVDTYTNDVVISDNKHSRKYTFDDFVNLHTAAW